MEVQDLKPERKDLFLQRLKKAKPMLELAKARGLSPTPWAVEALAYWHRAEKLQKANLAGKKVSTGDDLQDSIPIYDTTRRRYAGFSNVLEQLFYGAEAPKFEANYRRGYDYAKFRGSHEEWMYLCLVHRITGSGASFEKDHGFRNTIVPQLAAMPARERAGFVRTFSGRPIFTSIGNQIPAFMPKTDETSHKGGHEYLGVIAPKLVKQTYDWLVWRLKTTTDPCPIKVAVDQALFFQAELGQRRFVFALTAWAMDIAEYLPHLVNPASDCYHGKNAVEAMHLCFDKKKGSIKNPQDFLDAGTRLFADVTGTHPMDVEDAAPGCDLIRWSENFVPKKGFDFVIAQGLFNSCCIKHDKGRQPA